MIENQTERLRAFKQALKHFRETYIPCSKCDSLGIIVNEDNIYGDHPECDVCNGKGYLPKQLSLF